MSFRQRADADTIYAPDAFDSQIGKTVPVRVLNRPMSAIIVAATVSEDGTEVEMTIDTSEDIPELA